jgi:hypothetical protein
MTVLLECVDRLQRSVILSDHVWRKHILPRRPILEGLEHCIPWVLKDPNRIFQDATHPDRECFYRQRIIPYRPHLYLKVVVEYPTVEDNDYVQSVGTVVTVIPVTRFTPGERQLWPP